MVYISVHTCVRTSLFVLASCMMYTYVGFCYHPQTLRNKSLKAMSLLKARNQNADVICFLRDTKFPELYDAWVEEIMVESGEE